MGENITLKEALHGLEGLAKEVKIISGTGVIVCGSIKDILRDIESGEIDQTLSGVAKRNAWQNNRAIESYKTILRDKDVPDEVKRNCVYAIAQQKVMLDKNNAFLEKQVKYGDRDVLDAYDSIDPDYPDTKIIKIVGDEMSEFWGLPNERVAFLVPGKTFAIPSSVITATQHSMIEQYLDKVYAELDAEGIHVSREDKEEEAMER